MPETATKKQKAINALGDRSRKNLRTNVWGLASYLVDMSGLDEAAEIGEGENYRAVAKILLDARSQLNKLKHERS